ncbi:ERAD-associated protein, partial [Kappamyces sp. JEL0680]
MKPWAVLLLVLLRAAAEISNEPKIAQLGCDDVVNRAKVALAPFPLGQDVESMPRKSLFLGMEFIRFSSDMGEQPPTPLPSHLEECSDLGHVPAMQLLLDVSLYGRAGAAVNTPRAFSLIQSLFLLSPSEDEGPSIAVASHEQTDRHQVEPSVPHPLSQDRIELYRTTGLLYATGLGVKRDYALAQVYMTIAALYGDPLAHQVLGYWYMAGIGTPKSTEKALWHYRKLGAVLIKLQAEGPLGGRRPRHPSLELAHDGIYGKGASGNGNPMAGQEKQQGESQLGEEDLVLLHKLQAEGGDILSQFMLGQLYYLGGDEVKVDYVKARYYFTLAAKQYPTEPDDGDENRKKARLCA